MTELAAVMIIGSVLLASATFLIIWVLEFAESEIIKTTSIIVYGLCFIVTAVTMVIEAIKLSF